MSAVDYVLKPVSPERLERAVARVVERRGAKEAAPGVSRWAEEFWLPHRSEMVRIRADDIERIDAERDYMRLTVGGRSFLLLDVAADVVLTPWFTDQNQVGVTDRRHRIIRRERVDMVRDALAVLGRWGFGSVFVVPVVPGAACAVDWRAVHWRAVHWRAVDRRAALCGCEHFCRWLSGD